MNLTYTASLHLGQLHRAAVRICRDVIKDPPILNKHQ